MPDVALTETQHERLAEIREELQEAFVGPYGTVRTVDAVDYLLDTYTPPDARSRAEAYERLDGADYPELQHVASDLQSVPGSGIDAAEMRGRLLAELDPAELLARLDAAREDVGTEADRVESSAGTEASNADGEDSEASNADGEDSEDGADAEGTGAVDEATGSGGTAGDGTAGEAPDTEADAGKTELETSPAAALRTAANRLLDEHDDKWRESDGDAPYEVDLPDGTTEAVRTRDDVRQLLFREY
jgi:hypothetical protein